MLPAQQNPAPTGVNAKKYLIPLTVFIILLSVGLFFFFSKNKDVKVPQKPEDSSFVLQDLKDSGSEPKLTWTVENLFNTYNQEASVDQKYLQLTRIALAINTEYEYTHNPKLRLIEEKLSNYVSENFKDQFQIKDFPNKCLDEECSKLLEDPEVQRIRQSVSVLELGLYKEQVENAFYLAAISKEDDKNSRFSNYLYAANIISGLDNAEASKSAVDLNSYLQQKYPEFWTQYQEDLKKLNR